MSTECIKNHEVFKNANASVKAKFIEIIFKNIDDKERKLERYCDYYDELTHEKSEYSDYGFDPEDISLDTLKAFDFNAWPIITQKNLLNHLFKKAVF